MTESARVTIANQDLSEEQRGEAELTAADIMSTPVVAVSVHDSVWDAWNALYRSDFHHLVVVDGTRCVGVIDDRRIALEWPRGPGHDLGRQVGQMIIGRVRCVLADTPVGELAGIMVKHHLDALPVVNPTGEVIGIVTAPDLLLILAYQRHRA
jgi:CBS domain-containing protein